MARRLIVAVDYGTTFTSVSHVLEPKAPTRTSQRGLGDAEAGEIYVIRDWPKGDGDCVPSIIAHKYSDAAEDSTHPYKWGHEIKYLSSHVQEQCDIVRYAKTQIHQCLENDLQLIGLQPVPNRDLSVGSIGSICEYLRFLCHHVYGDKESLLKRIYPKELADAQLRVEFIFGVPAAWTLPEQLKFMHIVKSAGMPNALRAAEPEAMAVRYLARNTSLKVGDIFIIVDAGGGTVDLITYKVETLEPPAMSEVSGLEGDFCGAIAIVHNFERLLLEKVAHMTDQQKRSRVIKKAKVRFEDVFMKEFKGCKSFVIDRDAIDTDEPMEITSIELMEEVFGPVLGRITELVRAQIRTARANLTADQKLERPRRPRLPVKTISIEEIVLGGGLSCNPYLYKKISERFLGTTVRKMPDCHTDVVRGLAMIALNQTIVAQRRSLKSYGIVTQYTEKGRIRGLRRMGGTFQAHTNESWVPVVEWIIRKNEAISEKEPFERLRTEIWDDKSDWIAVHEMVVTDEDIPLDEGYTHWIDVYDNPKYSFAEFVTDLSSCDRNCIKTLENKDGEKFWKVHLTLKLYIQDSELLLSVKTLFGRKQHRFPWVLQTEDNPNPVLGSLLRRGKVVPHSYTISLLEEQLEKEKRRQQKSKSRKRVVETGDMIPLVQNFGKVTKRHKPYPTRTTAVQSKVNQ